MKCSHTHAKSTLSRFVFTFTVFVTLIFLVKSEASCPSQSTVSAGWPRDSTVRFDVSALREPLRTQALKALDAWNNANSMNNSGVTFMAADSTHPAVLTFTIRDLGSVTAAGSDIHNFPGTSTAETAQITINADNTNFFDANIAEYELALFKAFLHEIGHTMGLADTPVPEPTASPERCGGQAASESIMNRLCGINDSGRNMPSSIASCDQGTVFQNSQYYRTPCPSTECNEGSGFQVDMCSYPGAGGCPPGYHSAGGCCQPDVPSPIVIDTDGSGFHLTSALQGVWFDFYGKGQPIRVSWTTANSTNAWLVLDRNNNERVDSALEMFGNYTIQPYSTDKNGFLALAEFDKSGAGGNEDRKIDKHDTIFSSLRLWIDRNHNAISEAEELHTLPELSVASLDLDYHEAKRIDTNGNQFRYRAKVKDNRGAQIGRWAWDVFLLTQ
jgi:hypothetical protein